MDLGEPHPQKLCWSDNCIEFAYFVWILPYPFKLQCPSTTVECLQQILRILLPCSHIAVTLMQWILSLHCDVTLCHVVVFFIQGCLDLNFVCVFLEPGLSCSKVRVNIQFLKPKPQTALPCVGGHIIGKNHPDLPSVFCLETKQTPYQAIKFITPFWGWDDIIQCDHAQISVG